MPRYALVRMLLYWWSHNRNQLARHRIIAHTDPPDYTETTMKLHKTFTYSRWKQRSTPEKIGPPKPNIVPPGSKVKWGKANRWNKRLVRRSKSLKMSEIKANGIPITTEENQLCTRTNDITLNWWWSVCDLNIKLSAQSLKEINNMWGTTNTDF